MKTYGTFADESLLGSTDADWIDGDLGDDTLIGNFGNDTILGGPDYPWSAEDFTTGTGNDWLDGGEGNDSLDGGYGNDTLIGGEGNDVLDGGDGAYLENDLYNPPELSLVDSLVGGAGNDTYLIDGTGDIVVENANEGIDQVNASVNYTLGANVENLLLTGSDAINGTGNSLSNTITGNSAANLINGGSGNDCIAAGVGNDKVIGGTGNDTLNPGVGVDTISGGSGVDLLKIDWSSLTGAIITKSISKDTAEGASSYKGTYTAKNSAGTVLSTVSFDGIENLIVNGKSVDLMSETAMPGVTIRKSSTETATTEQGGSVQYSVFLNRAPKESVTISFTSSDSTEGRVTTPSLTFTPDNWNTPQSLTIQGVDDYLDDGNVPYSVVGTIVTNDLTYNRVAVPAINLINNDDGQDKPLQIYGADDPVLNYVDYITGMNGDDRIYGGRGQDNIRGGRGNDRIYGDQDNDRLFGEEGNDELYGGVDDDTLDGGNGSDFLFGEQGRDTLLGGSGNDYLDGGLLNDSMVGGAGNDTYLVDSTGDVINDLGAVSDVDTVIITQTITYTLGANIENASVNSTAGNGNLTGNTLGNGLTGNDSKNTLDGGSGNDSLDGGAGSDSLLGGVGNDVMEGGAGNDTMRGGDGVDVADFAAAGLDISIDLTTGKATGEGTDLIFDIENILTGEGDDKLTGSSGSNSLSAGAGTDSLNGGAGNDTMAGCFYGANGGQGEIDTLTGGAGADLFQLGWSGGRFYDDGTNSNAGRGDYALITDFTVGTDRLQLKGNASQYFLGGGGITGVSGSGVYFDSNNNHTFDAADELLAILRSGNSTALTADNLIKTAAFV